MDLFSLAIYLAALGITIALYRLAGGISSGRRESGRRRGESLALPPSTAASTRDPVRTKYSADVADDARQGPSMDSLLEQEKRPDPIADSVGSGIFISYRRQDEPSFAGRLYDKLANRFGPHNVFIDVDSIELGLDFLEVINRSLSRCRVLIVVIGRYWLVAADGSGAPRLSNPDDYVRLEIEAALARKIRIIPVLVEDAVMPKSSQLPVALESLSRRNGISVSHATFSSDADRLLKRLDQILIEEA